MLVLWAWCCSARLTSLGQSQTLFGRGSATAVQLLARKSLMHYMGDADVQFLKISAGDLRALSKMRDEYQARL